VQELRLYLSYFLFWNVTERRLIVTDVSEQPICPSSRVRQSKKFFDFLNLEGGTERLSRSTVNYQSVLCNIPEERRSD